MRRGGRAHMERLYDADFTEFLQQRHIHAGYWDDGVYDGDLAAAQDRYVTRLFEMTDVAITGRVLDLGCGPGGVARLVSARSTLLVGLDLSLPQLSLARQATDDLPVALVLADAAVLPFRDEAFDLVIAIESSGHVTDKVALAREMRRVLRPGGRVILSDYTVERQATRWHRFCVRSVCETALPDPLDGFVAALERGGLRVGPPLDTSRETVVPWVDALLTEPNRSRLLAYARAHYGRVGGCLAARMLGPIGRGFAAAFVAGEARHIVLRAVREP